MHLSRTTFVGMVDDGQYRMPGTMHVTYCRQKVAAASVGSEDIATCQDCIMAMCWEEIDRMNCETHPGGG